MDPPRVKWGSINWVSPSRKFHDQFAVKWSLNILMQKRITIFGRFFRLISVKECIREEVLFDLPGVLKAKVHGRNHRNIDSKRWRWSKGVSFVESVELWLCETHRNWYWWKLSLNGSSKSKMKLTNWGFLRQNFHW